MEGLHHLFAGRSLSLDHLRGALFDLLEAVADAGGALKPVAVSGDPTKNPPFFVLFGNLTKTV